MLEDLLSGIPSEADIKFAPKVKQNETAPVSQTETNKMEKSPSHQGETSEKISEISKEDNKISKDDNIDDESKTPFHKHPRWLKMNRDNRQLMSTIENLTKTIEELKSDNKEVKNTLHKQVMPKWFIEKYGDNIELWNDISENLQIKEENKSNKNPEQTVKDAESYIDNQLNLISEDYDIDFTSEDGKDTKNEFLDFLRDNYNQPTSKYRVEDKDGNIDFYKGWDLFNEVKTKSPSSKKISDAKKQLANNSVSSGKHTNINSEKRVTPADLSKLRRQFGY